MNLSEVGTFGGHWQMLLSTCKITVVGSFALTLSLKKVRVNIICMECHIHL